MDLFPWCSVAYLQPDSLESWHLLVREYTRSFPKSDLWEQWVRPHIDALKPEWNLLWKTTMSLELIPYLDQITFSNEKQYRSQVKNILNVKLFNTIWRNSIEELTNMCMIGLIYHQKWSCSSIHLELFTETSHKDIEKNSIRFPLCRSASVAIFMAQLEGYFKIDLLTNQTQWVKNKLELEH